MKFVNNFCEINPIKIGVSPPRNGNPSLVVLSQHGGGMSFHHGMTVMQVKELIDALNHAAIEAESYTVIEVMRANQMAQYAVEADLLLPKIVANNAFLAASA